MTIYEQQCALGLMGYNVGLIDGVYGNITGKAISDFQRDAGLQADGIFGHDTEQKARELIAVGFKKPAADPEEPVTPEAPAAPSGNASSQQYLQADGFYHIPRGVNVRLSDHLMSREVMCCGHGCCTESKISKEMVDLFEEIRVDYGKPIEIVTAGGSGYRCPEHNAGVGGSAGSLHLTGSAFDMHANVIELLPVVLRHLKDGEYGVYSDFIHVGIWHSGYVNRYQ